ncbi:MAG: hypothetical protein R2771_12810 [Saprospiraceae bacterium]
MELENISILDINGREIMKTNNTESGTIDLGELQKYIYTKQYLPMVLHYNQEIN